MQPVKLLIPGRYWDSHIYAGRLYLFGLDGDIRTINWKPLIEEWNTRDELRLALTCAFLRSDYLYGLNLQALFHDREIRDIIARKFKNLAKENLQATLVQLANYTIGHQNNPCPFPHADTEIYYENLYVGGPSGLVRLACNKRTKYPVSTRPEKKWDAPVLGLSASYGSLALAAGEEGLFELDINKIRIRSNEAISNEPKRLSHDPCRDCNWTYYSIFASSDESGFLAAYTKREVVKQENGTSKRHWKRQLEDILQAEDIFGSSGYSWGVQDKLCQAAENGIRIVRYQPWDSTNDSLGHFNKFNTVPIPCKGDVISASTAAFGVVIELEDAIVVYPSSGDVLTLSGEPVNWRIFPRSKHYENQLHIVYEDRLEIISFNHDYLINQEEKLLGYSVMRQRSQGDMSHRNPVVF